MRRETSMGCGILKGPAAVLLLCILAAALYVYFQGPVDSPYETVNDLYEWEYMSLTAVYSTEAETATLNFQNGAPDGVVLLAGNSKAQWYLEKEVDGRWCSLRAARPEPQWEFRPEDCTPYSVPSGVINWSGGEFTWYCDVGSWYSAPLEQGNYRIVIPGCQHLHDTADLAVEFEVT